MTVLQYVMKTGRVMIDSILRYSYHNNWLVILAKGLMNLLMHWKMGQLPAPSKEQFSKYDVTENGTIIYFEDVWIKIENYTELTMFDLETYFIIFLGSIPVHYLMVFACKFCFAIDFKKKGNETEKIFHILTHLICPITFKDWDEIDENGGVSDNKENLAKVLKEMKYLLALFAVEHIALCTPVIILAFAIHNRNQYLNEYFPPGVNFINHSRMLFLPIFWQQKLQH